MCIYIDVARWKCITMSGTPFVTLGRGVLMVDDKGLYTSVVYNIYIYTSFDDRTSMVINIHQLPLSFIYIYIYM